MPKKRLPIPEKATVITPIPGRKIAMVVKRVNMRTHDDEAADKAYWLSRPVKERLEAVQMLRAQFMKPGQRMDKTFGAKRKMR